MDLRGWRAPPGSTPSERRRPAGDGAGAAADRPSSTIEDLVGAVARERCHAAFAQLFARLGPRLQAYLRNLGAEPALAEDLVQDVMATVWHRASRFEAARATASTWIFAIARNRFIDVLRRRPRAECDLCDLPEAEVPALVEAAEDRVYLTQLERHLHAIMKELPREQSELLRRSFFQYQSQSAIARELDLPLGTVKSRQRLALSRLRGMLRQFAD
jgi:RNA polymerase sigma-70 factor (ECF subfamily)